jgi:S1-C subfamily serine protease
MKLRLVSVIISLIVASTQLSAASSIQTPDGFRSAYEKAKGQVVGVSFTVRPMEFEPGVEGPKANGVVCGVIVDASGLLITTGDLFPEPGRDPRRTLAPTEFKLHFDRDTIVPAEAIGLDRVLNIAYLKFDPNNAPALNPVKFKPSPDLQVGDPVAIVGVLGRKYEFTPALFTATINARVSQPRTLFGVDQIIQDLTVGGLVLRMDGSAAGIVTKDVIGDSLDSTQSPGNFLAIIANMGEPQLRKPGYAMVLPYSEFKESLASPPALDLVVEVKRSWIGIVMQALNDDLRDYWDLSVPGGIIVGSVVDDSPAETGGLLPGDIITALNGDALRITRDSELPEFRRRVQRIGVGSSLELGIIRAGKNRKVTLTLVQAPKTASFADDYENEEFGLTVREITIDVQQALNLEPDAEGVVIEKTEEAGWADISGLFSQDLILSVNGSKVTTVGDIRKSLDEIKARREPEAIFFVMRPPDTLFIRVKTEYDAGNGASGS